MQLGHGMQGLSQELIKCWGKGTAIISPVNMPQAKLAPYAKKIHSIGGEVLFDPQMFYPKEGHLKLQAYDYWPSRPRCRPGHRASDARAAALPPECHSR